MTSNALSERSYAVLDGLTEDEREAVLCAIDRCAGQDIEGLDAARAKIANPMTLIRVGDTTP